MYIKQAVCYCNTNLWKVNEWKPVQSCQEKKEKSKKNQIISTLLKDLEQIVEQ